MELIDPVLLMFLLAGGYVFLVSCHFMRFQAEGKEWERNLLETAIVGGSLFLLVKIFAIPMFMKLFPQVYVWWQLTQRTLPFPYMGALLFTVMVAWILAQCINRFIPSGTAVCIAVEKYGGELLNLLHFAARTGRPVSLTMMNRKVYVGFIRATPTLRYPHTKILPTMSGFRDETTLKLTFNTIYWSVYDSLESRRRRGETVIEINHFGIVLPIEQIVSANLFDEGAYTTYFMEDTPPKSQNPTLTIQTATQKIPASD